jgi:hypothetical protein
MLPYFHVVSFIFYLLLWGSLVWCWISWLKSKPGVLRNWRAATLLLGFVCATISTSLNTWLYVHALYTGGYPIHYGFKDGYSGFHPVEWRFMQWGSLTALAGTVSAVAGRGKGRFVLAGISIFDLLCWYFDAMSM